MHRLPVTKQTLQPTQAFSEFPITSADPHLFFEQIRNIGKNELHKFVNFLGRDGQVNQALKVQRVSVNLQ